MIPLTQTTAVPQAQALYALYYRPSSRALDLWPEEPPSHVFLADAIHEVCTRLFSKPMYSNVPKRRFRQAALTLRDAVEVGHLTLGTFDQADEFQPIQDEAWLKAPDWLSVFETCRLPVEGEPLVFIPEAELYGEAGFLTALALSKRV